MPSEVQWFSPYSIDEGLEGKDSLKGVFNVHLALL